MSMGLSRLGLGLGAHRYAGGSSVIAPETYGLLARSIDADTLAGADGSGANDWPNVSTDTAGIVAGYTQATGANQPILGTANGHRFVARAGGSTVSFMTTPLENATINESHIFIVARVGGAGTSTVASLLGANTKIEAKGTLASNIGPRLVGSTSPWSGELDQQNVGLITVGLWTVFEAELYSAPSSGTALRVSGVTVDASNAPQLAVVKLDTLFSDSSYSGARTDTAVALMRVYSLSGGAMAPADVIGARALMQARADEMNGV